MSWGTGTGNGDTLLLTARPCPGGRCLESGGRQADKAGLSSASPRLPGRSLRAGAQLCPLRAAQGSPPVRTAMLSPARHVPATLRAPPPGVSTSFNACGVDPGPRLIPATRHRTAAAHAALMGLGGPHSALAALPGGRRPGCPRPAALVPSEPTMPSAGARELPARRLDFALNLKLL